MAEATDSRLRLIVQRIERLMEEKKGIADDIRDVFSEAKAVGYDTKTIRQLIARRAMKPDDRHEADAVLATYEAALGGDAPDPAMAPDEARREMAVAILAEQIEGIDNPDRAAALAEHVAVILDLRAEIAGLRTMEKERKALAKAEGFEPRPIATLVRWIEQCVKKGADAMRAGEAVFQMYRTTVEGVRDARATPVSSDPKLAALAAPPVKANTAKARKDASREAWLNGYGG